MAVDDTSFFAWLRGNNARVVLVEMGFRVQQDEELGSPLVLTATPTDSVVRMATQAYVQGDARYFDCVRTVPTYNREVDKARLGGQASISFGNVEIDNSDGRMDFLLDLACDGSPIAFYIGDLSWDRVDFRLLFKALVQNVTSGSPPQITIAIRDAGLLIDKSIGGSTLIGGSGPNKDKPRAYFFGYAHNVTCELKDFGPLLYDYAEQGSIADTNSPPVGGVRDEGLGVVYSDNNDGTMNLSASPAGTITADLFRKINDSLPGARASQLTDELATVLGGLTTPDQFLGAHPSYIVGGVDDYPVGIYISDKRNLIDVLTEVAATALSFWGFTREGKFTYGRLWPQDLASLHLPLRAELTVDDVVTVDAIAITRNVPTYFSVPIIVNKNWTQQNTFAGALTADEQALYSRQGLPIEPPIADFSQDYNSTPEQYHLTLVKAAAQETLISASSDERVADAATQFMFSRRAQLLPWTEFLEVTTDLRFFYLELGDAITFDYGGRYGYTSEVQLQVSAIEMNVTEESMKIIAARRRKANVLEVDHDDIA